MDKKNSYIILAVVAVFVIALVVIIGSQEKPAGTSGSVAPSGLEEGVSQTSEDVDKIVREAIDTQNASLCEKIKKEESRKWCEKNAVIAKASIDRDYDICNQLGEVDKLECQDNVTITRALDAKNLGLCQQLNDKNRIGGCEEYIASAK